jgi:hypothetical protein
MSNNQSIKTKKTMSPDWFLKGVLTKIGETFDRLTGRNWKPSSSLATSELIERIKLLLDAEVKDSGKDGKFVPHNIKLKMQWDKFSTDSDKAIDLLKNELHIAAIDHINDRRYYTYAPINIEIKPDYFTEGVKLLASFDKFDEEEREVAVNVTIPDLKVKDLIPAAEKANEPEKEVFVVGFNLNGKPKEIEFKFGLGERKSVGRTKENDLMLDDTSVSKVHAAFVFNSQSRLMLADTGSTNGTFINGKRIAYGRAFNIGDGDVLKFGTVEVSLKHIEREPEIIEVEELEPELSAAESKDESENFEKSGILSTENNAENSKIFKTPEAQREFSDSVNFTDEDFPAQAEIYKESQNENSAVNPTEKGIMLDFGEQKTD